MGKRRHSRTRLGLWLGSWTALVVSFGVGGCKPEPPINPYLPAAEEIDSLEVVSTEVFPTPEPGSFTWLHQRMFLPTCANAGCHDGSFEPDFRTIGSSYNTLVYHPGISNDAAGSFTYRVLPGDPEGSLLMKRLLESIPNTSGQMPLEVDATSDWPEASEEYLSALTAWIAEGAPNASGDLPTEAGSVNLPPTIVGWGGFPLGAFDAPFPRDPADGYALQATAGMVDLWFAFDDDSASPEALTAALQYAGSPGAFTGSPTLPLEFAATGFEAPGFFGETGWYQHHIVLDLTGLSDTTLYVRASLSDGALEVLTPGPASPPYMSTLFSIVIE